MISLTAISETPTYIARYVSIRDSKKTTTRAPLTVEHALIESRYKSFDQAVKSGRLESLTTNPKVLLIRDDLRACYKGPTAPLKELKKAIKAAQLQRILKYCPMCGTTLPTTFDHYLPAVKFPEFSVHPLNLVPCCAKCNSTKDDDWLCATGKRQFLHAYTDSLPDLQFLSVDLVVHPALTAVGAKFSLSKPSSMALSKWELISTHFSRLKLLDRYNEQCNDQIAEILADCKIFSDTAGGHGDVRLFLKRQATDRASVYGRNHWVVVLMSMMSDHVDFPAWVAAA